MSDSSPSASTEPTLRDLTDTEQNAAILARATEMLEDSALDAIAMNRTKLIDAEFVRGADPVELEAIRAAVGKLRLRSCKDPVHVTVVWAMYNETTRMMRPSEHEHGEDFLREKVKQMRWLFEPAGLDHTFDLLACDDGCPESPSSAEMMQRIIDEEGYGDFVRVVKLADGIDQHVPVGPGFAQMKSPKDSRKGGAITYAMWSAIQATTDSLPEGKEHVVLYTDADLSANLAQAGTLVHAILEDGCASAIGQRYGVPGSILVTENGATTEPDSTGNKRNRDILLFRHFARVKLIPSLEHVLDTQAGFKAFRASVLREVLPQMQLFNETFDVELLYRVADTVPDRPFAMVPILFVEDFAMTNFPSFDPGEQNLNMIKQIVKVYDVCIGERRGIPEETAQLLELCRYMRIELYKDIIAAVESDGARNKTELFERRFDVQALMQLR